MSEQPDFRYFTISMISHAFGLTDVTVKKRLQGVSPDIKIGRSNYWNINRISKLIDVRKDKEEKEPYEPIGIDPYSMRPSDRKSHFQAEDAHQAYLMKKTKNRMENYQLIQVSLVEKGVTNAFKSLAISLDTLPDILERDGIINASDVVTIKKLVDNMRHTLAVNLVDFTNGAIDDESL